MIAIIITLGIIVLMCFALMHAQPADARDDEAQMRFCEEWRENHGQR